MRSREQYTNTEVISIKELLKEKTSAPSPRQKTIRGKLRSKYQFFINEFPTYGGAFNHYDFENLIKSGRIKIISDSSNKTKIKLSSTKQVLTQKQKSLSNPIQDINRGVSNVDKITWGMCQELSDIILADGLESLTKSTVHTHDNLPIVGYGDYLISHDDIRYMGESKEGTMRVRTHFSRKTGFYYKNYLNKYPMGDLSINDFTVQVIDTKIGRKELEEFGIVNLPAILNKAHKGARKIVSGNPNEGIWGIVIGNYKTLFEDGEQALMNTKFNNWQKVIADKSPVVYWIEHIDHGLIYIGETYDMKKRFKNHSEKTYSSALRRHIGTDIFDFGFIEKYGKKTSFTDQDDLGVNKFLKECEIRIMPTNFGRRELEEYLIRKHKPSLNRKENK